MDRIHFWNGNKTAARQAHELELVKAVVDPHIPVTDDRTDYPAAEDEGRMFENGCDVLVTVAGNTKFSGHPHIALETPLAKGITGHRILISRPELSGEYAGITQLSQLQPYRCGVPATWADADLFRANGCHVAEKGSLEEMFARLADKECDYLALGANEVTQVFKTLGGEKYGLTIESELVLYYPLPLVFYVHPEKPELAEHIAQNCTREKLEAQFEKHYGHYPTEHNLSGRRVIRLRNPALPQNLQGLDSEFVF